MKYWVYMNGEVPGCYTPAEELTALNGFSATTLVCPAEGEIVEKNWRRSGEFADIVKLVQERDVARPPAAPADAALTGDVNALLDSTSARLFGHVSGLMKELENRRDEQALLQSTQRQLVEQQEQLQRQREKAAELEGRMPRLRELEESSRKDQDRIQMLEKALKGREDGLAELRHQLEKSKSETEASKRRLNDTLNDLAIRNRLVDKLSRDLTEKELSLAKSLGIIRRLEEDLHRIVPAPAAEAAPAQASAAKPAEADDDDLPHHQAPQAQSAIVGVFKRIISKDVHS